jgi:hypothetical protein
MSAYWFIKCDMDVDRKIWEETQFKRGEVNTVGSREDLVE